MNEDPRMDQLLKVANLATVSSRNHGLAAKLATDLLLLRSLGRLFPYRKFTSSLSAGIGTLSLTFFLMKICCFATLLKRFLVHLS